MAVQLVNPGPSPRLLISQAYSLDAGQCVSGLAAFDQVYVSVGGVGTGCGPGPGAVAETEGHPAYRAWWACSSARGKLMARNPRRGFCNFLIGAVTQNRCRSACPLVAMVTALTLRNPVSQLAASRPKRGLIRSGTGTGYPVASHVARTTLRPRSNEIKSALGGGDGDGRYVLAP